MLSADLNILVANEAYQKLLSIPPEDLIGKSIDSFQWSTASARGDDKCNEIRASLDRVVLLKKADSVPLLRIRCSVNGELVQSLHHKHWNLLNRPLLDEGGNVEFIIHSIEQSSRVSSAPTPDETVVATFHAQQQTIVDLRSMNADLTAKLENDSRLDAERLRVSDALHESEQRFRMLANRLPGIVYRRIVSPDGMPHDIYVSEGVEKLLGVSAQSVMLGEHSLLDFIHPDDRVRKLEAMRDAVTRKVSLTIDVRKLTKPDKKLRWWRVHTTPTPLSDGAIQWDGFAIDITDQKLAEQQLQQAMKMEVIGQLTGGIAHDFNNLLTIIMGNAEALVSKLSDRPRLRHLAVLTQIAAERGSELTNRLLLFARRQALEPKTVDVNNLISGMDSLWRRALGEGIKVEVEQAGGLWRAHVDPGQLETALLNIAINARDAMPHGGKLTIETGNVQFDETYTSAHEELSPGGYVMLAISDNGCGMSKETLARAFEPFFTTKPFGRGSGLGLSMVFGFLKQSGGHIDIYSEVGQGTTVKLYLPRSTNEESGLVAIEGSEPEPMGNEVILLVEDDTMVRNHVQGMLTELGYQTIVASNGPEALAIIDQGAGFDLLFTDIVMPGGMTGKVLADLAIARRPGLKVLFTSGYNSDYTENDIVDHGRVDLGVNLLRKPYRRRDLADRLHRILHINSHEGENHTWWVQ